MGSRGKTSGRMGPAIGGGGAGGGAVPAAPPQTPASIKAAEASAAAEATPSFLLHERAARAHEDAMFSHPSGSPERAAHNEASKAHYREATRLRTGGPQAAQAPALGAMYRPEGVKAVAQALGAGSGRAPASLASQLRGITQRGGMGRGRR
jgi:hypothetical protein